MSEDERDEPGDADPVGPADDGARELRRAMSGAGAPPGEIGDPRSAVSWEVLLAAVPADWLRRVANRYENVRRADPANSVVTRQCHAELVQVLEEVPFGYGWRLSLPEWLDEAVSEVAAYHQQRVYHEGHRQVVAGEIRALQREASSEGGFTDAEAAMPGSAPRGWSRVWRWGRGVVGRRSRPGVS